MHYFCIRLGISHNLCCKVSKVHLEDIQDAICFQTLKFICYCTLKEKIISKNHKSDMDSETQQ